MIPELTWGRVNDPSHFLIYVAFECDKPIAWQVEAWQKITWILAEIGNCATTTRRPDLRQNAYGVIVVGYRLGHTAPDFGGRQAAAVSPARWRLKNAESYPEMSIYIDTTHDPLHDYTTDDVFYAVFHEIGHAAGGWYVGPSGSHWPPFRGQQWWDQLKAGMVLCAANARPYRTKIPVPPPDPLVSAEVTS